MFTVALLAQKGGVGKTTLAYTLAVQAELADTSAAVLDADPQASAWSWSRKRLAGGKDTPSVASVGTPDKLREAFTHARAQDFDWLFIDTPAGVSELPATAAALADLLLIPCVPSVLNMEALASTVKLAQQAHKPAYFLVNRGRSKAINDDCLAALVSAYGLPATNAHVSARLPIVDAEAEGLALVELSAKDPSIGKGQDEFRVLFDWLTKQKEKANVTT
jgi:chromosome partitioning protein